MKGLCALCALLCSFGFGLVADSSVSGPHIEGQMTYKEIPPIINPPRTDGKWPGLRYYDARYFCQLALQVQFLMWYQNPPKRTTVKVRSASMQLVEKERLPPPYPDGEYESRWDVLINGQVIDPRDFAILYDQKVMNLGTLFTYAQELYPNELKTPWQE